MKKLLSLLALGAFLILSAALAISVPASAPATASLHLSHLAQPANLNTPTSVQATSDVAASASITVTQFLPLVFRTNRNPRACPVDSPFSLQIAALHEVLPDAAAMPQDGEAAEWAALLEANFARLTDALWESGACWSRVRISWDLIQPNAPVEGQPPVYNWGPYHDDKLALVARTGVQLIATIDDVPDWAADEPFQLSCSPIRQDRLDEFAQFVTDLVTRYQEPPWNIHVWELRNEPDGTWEDRADVGQGCGGMFGAKYVAMAQAAYPAIKAADPGATVLMGGVAYDAFAEYDGPFNRYFPDDVMAAGGAAYLDAINLHYFADYAAEWERWVAQGDRPTCGDVEDGQGAPYEAWGIDIGAKIKHFRNRMSICFDVHKPVWLTELAEHGYADQPDSLEQHARYVIQGHARALASGVVNITWFALVSPPYDPNEQGLLYSDLTPKPAFYSYQTLTSELQRYTYSHTLDAAGVEGYGFVDSTGQSKIVAWAWGEPLEPAYLTMPGTSQVRRVDRHGTVTVVLDGGAGDADGRVNGSIQIELPAPPVDPDTEDTYRFTAEPLFLSP